MKEPQVEMPFGKFRGWLLAEIDTQYLNWCLGNIENLKPALREAMLAEIRRRQQLARFEDFEMVDEIIAAGVHALAKVHHPDRGGTTAAMQRVTGAADWLRQAIPRVRT